MNWKAFWPDAFMAPGRFWWLLLIPLLVALYVVLTMRRNKRAMRYTNTSVLGAVVPVQSQWRRHLAVALSLLSLVTLTAAFARPAGVEKVPRERATVVLVIDTSMSMQATDVKPDRLAAAKDAAKTFVRSLPGGFNVSIVALAGTAQMKSPPTTDRGMVDRAIDALEVAPGTAVGDALSMSLQAVKQAPKGDGEDPAPAAVVLLSDGQNTAGSDPAAAVTALKEAKIPVFTIAYGTDLGYVDLDGKREPVPPDHALMEKIASQTGGKTFGADDAKQLSAVYKSIRSDVGYEEVPKEITAIWAGLGLAFAVVAALAAVSLGARKL